MNKDNAKDYLPLVQALAEGKVIEYKNRAGWGWHVEEDVAFCFPPDHYRIKPEPREIWANRFPDGYESPADYDSAEAAKAKDHTKGSAVQVRYREVIE